MARRAKQQKNSRPAAPAPAPRTANDDVLLVGKIAALFVLGLFIYWPALTGDWLWDDRDLVADNGLIHDPAGLWKIWAQPSVMFDFLPLKISVEWIEWRLFGEETLGYHVVNLALHLTSGVLLWRLFWKLGLRYAWVGALIFTVHPLQVESVAWMAELKNTLSLPFFLLTLIAWVDYAARGRKTDYVLALVTFLLAMLAKPTMVMFPLVILLYAWWRRGKIAGRDILDSAPFFAVSLAVGVATVVFLGRTTGEQHVLLGGPLSRLACAGLSLAFYFSKCVLPVDLMTIYPRWKIDPPTAAQFLPWPVLAAVMAYLWTKRASWGRPALFGLGFFVLNLLPFIGLTAGSYMNYTWVMDHIVYIPMLGLIGLAVAAMDQVRTMVSPLAQQIGALVMAVVLAWMTWASHRQAALYTGLETLWTANVALNPAAALPHNDLGVTYARRGDEAGALAQFRLAAELDPRYTDAHHNFGITLLKTGAAAEALAEFEMVQRLDPNNPEAYFNLGLVLAELKRDDEAIQEYQRTLALNPGYMSAYNNLAILLMEKKRMGEAVALVRAGLLVDPANATLEHDLAVLEEAQAPATSRPRQEGR